VWLNRRSRELIAWTVPVFGLVAVFFAFMLCFVSSPFNLQPAPTDGQGMVPSLQNPYMLAHPPLLYLGYVGLTVPFAFAMGALLFNLSLFGTFLTRSGVIDSIHSFARSSIGGWFLAFLSLMIVLSVALIRWRLPLLRTKTRLESLVSREATFLYNNLLLVALC